MCQQGFYSGIGLMYAVQKLASCVMCRFKLMEIEAGRRFEGSTCHMCEENVMAGGDADAASSGSIFVDHDRPSHLQHAISHLYGDSLFSDVTLCAGSEEIKCHRNILACSSSYFLVMFKSELGESHQTKIQIKEMEASTLRLVLDYVYTGKVELTVENVQSVLSAANLFQMINLRDGCANFMMHHISEDNCVGVYFFARAHECHNLAESARQLVNAEFEAVCQLPEFLSLPADKLVDIISDDQVLKLTLMCHQLSSLSISSKQYATEPSAECLGTSSCLLWGCHAAKSFLL